MMNTTVSRLQCPKKKRGASRCKGSFQLIAHEKLKSGPAEDVFDVRSGDLKCLKCQAKFPILAGVAIVVDDVRLYLLNHVKGIAQAVQDSEIPREYLQDYLEAKAEIQIEHIEDDLEAERVNALYLMNHYLRVGVSSLASQDIWWKPRRGQGSPLIDSLVKEYWDQGPFAQIQKWVAHLGQKRSLNHVVELGCGVGGLYPMLKNHLQSYLGIDSSFASIAMARHLSLGVPYRGSLRIPEDLLQGPLSRSIHISPAKSYDGQGDFLVGDLENPPALTGQWDLALVFNAIDMLDNPSSLPAIQYDLLKNNGIAIQSCPYIWHEVVAKKLRARLPRGIQDSARAAEWLYEQAGFKIEEKIDHLPWLFFKHVRQLEIYSVHLFKAKKGAD